MTDDPAGPFLCSAVLKPPLPLGAYANDADLAAAVAQPNACRIALDWARVEPQPGRWDEYALADARQSLTVAREGGLEPLLTLHRGRDPVWFRDQEGWLRGDAVQLFCRYVVKVVEELGDLVTYYVTIESPMGLTATWALDASHGSVMESGARRVLRGLLHAHGAARRTVYQATPRHGPRRAATPRVGMAHTMRACAPRRSSSPLDRAAAAAADYYWNRLPLRVLEDGRLHAPLGRGQYLLELEHSLDFVGIIPAPRAVVSWTPGRYLPPSLPFDPAGRAGPGAGTITALLRHAGTAGRSLMVMPEIAPSMPHGALSTLRHVHLAAIARVRVEGVHVAGYLESLALL